MNFTLYAALYSLVIVGFFAIAALVILRQKSDTYKYFGAFAIALGLWQLLQFSAQLLAHRVWSPYLLAASVFVSVFMGLYFMLFARAYSVGVTARRGWLYATAFIIGMAAFLSRGLLQAEITRAGIAVQGLDIFYVVPLLYAGATTVYGLVGIFRHMRQNKNADRRQQERTLLLAVVQAVIVILFFTVFFPDSSSTQIVIPISCFITVAIIAYSMVFHRLFDIRFFVLRAAVYLLTVSMVTIFFAIPAAFMLTKILSLHLSHTTFTVLVAWLLVVAYGLQYLRSRFDKITNRIFYRYYYDPQDVLDKLSDILVRTVDRETLCVQSGEIIRQALRPNFVGFLLLDSHNLADVHLTKRLADLNMNVFIADDIDPNKHSTLIEALRRNNIALGVKLRTNHEDLGFMVLGYKQSGEQYVVRDQRLLGIAADEIAIGLQNALRFEQIEQFNATLQERIDDATRQLRRTNDKLRKLDETKDDFISMASHQLRTPLTSVKGYVSMVLDGDAGKISPLQRKLLTQSFISSQRMVYLISDLLNVSRLKTGKFVIEPVPTNLAAVIKEEVEQLVETARGRNLELSFHMPEHFPTLMLDETKIRQVIMNFIDNAVYYTPSGGHIVVNLVEKPKTIEFTVVDDGIGVPRHEQHHLFSKFYRAPNAKRARPDGTGLGLFMAKKVIIAQGGAIIFRSQEGRGSTFGFTFAKDTLAPTSRAA